MWASRRIQKDLSPVVLAMSMSAAILPGSKQAIDIKIAPPNTEQNCLKLLPFEKSTSIPLTSLSIKSSISPCGVFASVFILSLMIFDPSSK